MATIICNHYLKPRHEALLHSYKKPFTRKEEDKLYEDFIKKAKEADLNVIIIEPKSKQNQAFLNKFMNKRSVLIVNKVDNSKIRLSSKIKKLKPILISIKKKKNIQRVITLIKHKIKNQFKGNENILISSKMIAFMSKKS